MSRSKIKFFMPQIRPIIWLIIVLILNIVILLLISNIININKLVEHNKNFLKKSNKIKW